MKVLFIGVGNTPYFNSILNKMNQSGKIEIVNFLPASGTGHEQIGVFSDIKKYGFEVLYGSIFKIRTKIGIKNLSKLIFNIRPNFIVVSDEYLPLVIFNPLFLFLKHFLNFKLYLKCIPFGVAPIWEQAEQKSVMSVLKIIYRIMTYNMVDGFLNYTTTGRQILGSYLLKDKPIFVTYNSSDSEKIAEVMKNKSISRHKEELLFIGRLVKWKNVDLLLESFSIVKKDVPALSLKIIGDGPEYNSLSTIIQKNGIQDVTMVGPIYDYESLAEYFLSCDLFVLPGMGGLAINDAMAFGNAVICSVCDGTEKDLVFDNQNGYFFQTGNKESLVKALRKFLSQTESEKERMRNKSLEIIKTKINVNSVAKNYINAFSIN